MYIMHPVPFFRTDINLRQLSFFKMFLVITINSCVARKKISLSFVASLQSFNDQGQNKYYRRRLEITIAIDVKHQFKQKCMIYIS